jgi:SPP1 family predicted phage head-tail adaptor
MNVFAGKLDKRVRLMKQSETRNSLNQKINAWAEIANGTVWAAIEPLRSSERIQSSALQTEITHRVTIRYRADVRAEMRVYYGVRQFAVIGLRSPDERGEYLELTCLEGNNA